MWRMNTGFWFSVSAEYRYRVVFHGATEELSLAHGNRWAKGRRGKRLNATIGEREACAAKIARPAHQLIQAVAERG